LDECIFCKIASGEIPVKLYAESTHAVAFEDREPRQPIHILIVPKRHFTDIADIAGKDDEVLLDLIKLGTEVASKYSEGSFRMQFNTGAEAGQTVFHAHGHVTSRTPKAL
jgi:histidine triad (HIT) family protein